MWSRLNNFEISISSIKETAQSDVSYTRRVFRFSLCLVEEKIILEAPYLLAARFFGGTVTRFLFWGTRRRYRREPRMSLLRCKMFFNINTFKRQSQCRRIPNKRKIEKGETAKKRCAESWYVKKMDKNTRKFKKPWEMEGSLYTATTISLDSVR